VSQRSLVRRPPGSPGARVWRPSSNARQAPTRRAPGTGDRLVRRTPHQGDRPPADNPGSVRSPSTTRCNRSAGSRPPRCERLKEVARAQGRMVADHSSPTGSTRKFRARPGELRPHGTVPSTRALTDPLIVARQIIGARTGDPLESPIMPGSAFNRTLAGFARPAHGRRWRQARASEPARSVVVPSHSAHRTGL